jgi:hypothetical protein
MTAKPHAASCDRNREPILAVLLRHLGEARSVLEIGSGTGQHAVYFAAAMPWLRWQASDHRDHLPGIGQWLDAAALANTPAALELQAVAGAGLQPAPRCRWPRRPVSMPCSPPTRCTSWAGTKCRRCSPGAGADGARGAVHRLWAVQLRWRLQQRQQPSSTAG